MARKNVTFQQGTTVVSTRDDGMLLSNPANHSII